MLTVRDILATPGVSLGLAAGSDGLANQVSWVHVSELGDPTPWL
jgi:purine catabolism regulator